MESYINYLKTCLDKQEKKLEILEQLLRENINYNKQILNILKEQVNNKTPINGSEELKVSIDSLAENFSQISIERKTKSTRTKNFLTYNTEEVKKHLKL